MEVVAAVAVAGVGFQAAMALGVRAETVEQAVITIRAAMRAWPMSTMQPVVVAEPRQTTEIMRLMYSLGKAETGKTG
jgi:hypothetical protein